MVSIMADNSNSRDRLAALQRKVLDPGLLAGYTDQSNHQAPINISHIPWRIAYESTNNDNNSADDSTAAAINGGEHRTVLLKESYLDLRRQQNIAWAEDRLVEGISLAKHSKTYRAAEKCYQQGLEVVPDHAPLHVAYGALVGSQEGRRDEALQMFDRALKIDPECANAQRYKEAILQRHRQSGNKNSSEASWKLKANRVDHHEDSFDSSSIILVRDQNIIGGKLDDPEPESRISGAAQRFEKAMQDASLEEAFLRGTAVPAMGELPTKSEPSSDNDDSKAAKNMTQYPLVFVDEQDKSPKRKDKDNNGDEQDTAYTSQSEEETDQRSRKRKRKKKSKKKEKKRKKRRRKERTSKDTKVL